MDVEFVNALFGFVWQAGQEGPDDGGRAVRGDRGGFTRLGITESTWDNWLHDNGLPFQPITTATISTLSSIYYTRYWKPVTYMTMLSGGLRFELFDFAVTAGPATSIRLLQQTLGFSSRDVDGLLGPYTACTATAKAQSILIDQLAQAQLQYYRSLADFSLFGAGWESRTLRRRVAAQGLSKQVNTLFMPARNSPLYEQYLAEQDKDLDKS